MKDYDAQTVRLKKLDAMIRKENTGPASNIGKELGCSTRTVHSNLNLLRGHVKKEKVYIIYNNQLKSYVYSRGGTYTPGSSWKDDEKPTNSPV